VIRQRGKSTAMTEVAAHGQFTQAPVLPCCAATMAAEEPAGEGWCSSSPRLCPEAA
jgi:hypothetical protein